MLSDSSLLTSEMRKERLICTGPMAQVSLTERDKIKEP